MDSTLPPFVLDTLLRDPRGQDPPTSIQRWERHFRFFLRSPMRALDQRIRFLVCYNVCPCPCVQGFITNLAKLVSPFIMGSKGPPQLAKLVTFGFLMKF